MPTATERKALRKELQKLNEYMVTLAELSEIAIRKAADSLARLDPTSAEEVFTLDEEIYALQIEIEKTCGDLIALHAPVASDLRTVTTSLKITTDLDRIGRYAKDIAETALELQAAGTSHYEKLPGLPQMVNQTVEMVDAAVDAFVRRDAQSVRNLAEVDDNVDLMQVQAIREIVARMKEGSLDIEVGTHFVLVARYLERIADHAVNIAERVVYMVTGERVPRVRAADRAKQLDPS